MSAPASLSQITATKMGAMPGLLPIVQPYLVVLFSVPFYIDASGRRWIDALWAKDLLEHTRYIKHMTLVASASLEPAPAGAVAMDQVAGLRELHCIDLPQNKSSLSALLFLPRTLSILWRALAQTRIVHTAVVAWPLPEAWLLIPLLWMRRRTLYINIESAFWRPVRGQKVGVLKRIRAAATERLNRYCVEHSDISTFTHEGYRQSLLRVGQARGHVVEASWIDEGNLVSRADLLARIDRRGLGPKRLRLVFAGRLNEAKGLLLLLESTIALLRAGTELELDIFGEGPLEAECESRVQAPDLRPWIRLRGSLPYGDPFFAALRQYDALVVPSISDEQPRIVFDSFSQGLPVIASRTPGLMQCVDEGATGRLFDVGNPRALQELVSSIAANPRMLSDMSLACLARASGLTHRHMHEARWRLLVDAFPALTKA